MTDWHPEDIKSAVRKRNITLSDVARGADLHPNALRLALTFPREQAERAIAAALEIDPKVIWPSRYNADGSRKRPQPSENYAAPARFGNRAVAASSQTGAIA